MPQLDWAIDIIPSTSGTGAAFHPKLVPPAHPGDPLKAQIGYIVTWGNRTGDTHQPSSSPASRAARRGWSRSSICRHSAGVSISLSD